MNFGFIIDNRKCIGCHACTVACKSEHNVPIGVNRTWVKYIEKGRFPNTRRLFSVMRCNHCEDAPCVEICPTTALYSRTDGIVDFDNRRCIGCKSCMQACPYDALYIDPETHTAAKCNYCAHRVDIGLEPACVNVCPVHAIISGDMDDPLTEISALLAREQVTVRKVEKGTRPKLFYIDGDEAALNPTETNPSGSYMWNSQLSGVGHFAKYAEARIAQSDPLEMAERLVASAAGDNESPVSQELQQSPTNLAPGLQENAQRVYDAPDKGVLWDWEVSGYVWTKAISAGAFLVPFLAATTGLSSVSTSIHWTGLALGLIFLLLTGVLLVKDLDQPARFAYVLLRPQWNSWLVRGGYAIAIYGCLLTLAVAARLWGWFVVEPIILWASALFAVLTAVYTAFLFAQAKGRDFWQSPMLALHMLVHAFMAGAALFAIIGFVVGDDNEWQTFLRAVLYAGISFNLVVILLEMTMPHATADAKKTVRMIVSGAFKPAFWGGALLLGNVLPLVLLGLASTEMLAGAGLLVLIGIFITEHIWVQAPQRVPLS